jgi:hypothetical protein
MASTSLIDRADNGNVIVSGGVLTFKCKIPKAGIYAIPLSEIKGVAVKEDSILYAHVVYVWTGPCLYQPETTFGRWYEDEREARQVADFIIRMLGQAKNEARDLKELLKRNIDAMKPEIMMLG